MPTIRIAAHPLLDVCAFVTHFPGALAECATSAAIAKLLARDAEAPFVTDDATRKHVRDLLRHGGYKPTGRGKPASEYLLGAAADAPLASINAAVDACNAVSLHAGLPISVIDLDRASEPFSIDIAAENASYVFNATGQSIDLAGLVCLFDEAGPCANAVKDAQRTKTSADTRRTLSIVWGTSALPGRARSVAEWYRALLGELATKTELAG
jgi:DNA/RNA-binding domain of Phe-tRNA-synthetase-like protein